MKRRRMKISTKCCQVLNEDVVTMHAELLQQSPTRRERDRKVLHTQSLMILSQTNRHGCSASYKLQP